METLSSPKPAKLVAIAAVEPGAGRSLCTASIAMSLARRWRCLAVDLDVRSGSLQKFLGTSRSPNLQYLPLSRSDDDTETLLNVMRSSPADYAVARLAAGTTDESLEIFSAADVPIIVTDAASSSLDKVVEFLQLCGAAPFEGRRVYMIVNRIQRGGEQKAAAEVVRKIKQELGLNFAILGTVLYEPRLEAGLQDQTAIAFEDMSFRIERDPVAPLETTQKTARPAAKARSSASTKKLTDAIKRIKEVESVMHAQATELKRLQERIASLEVSAATSQLRRKAAPKRRYILPVMGALLALSALIAAPPLMKKRPAVPQPPAVQVIPPVQAAQVVQAVPVAQAAAPVQQPPAPVEPPVAGEVAHQALPEVPQAALDTIRGKVSVSVKVTVDPSGTVMETAFEAPGPSKYFAGLAMDAARNWKFTPPRVDGRNVSSEWILQFAFENTATNAFATQLRPPKA
jgi:TonB family protein